MYSWEVLQYQTYIKGRFFLVSFMKHGTVQAAHLPLSPLQNKPCPLVCLHFSLPNFTGFRIFETAETKGDKVNEWHYWGQTSNHTSVFPLILFFNATKIIVKPDNRDLLTEEKENIEFISVKQLTLGIKRTMLPWLCKRVSWPLPDHFLWDHMQTWKQKGLVSGSLKAFYGLY